MKHFFKSCLIILSLFCGLLYLSEPTFATSLNLTASSSQVAPGATFTVSISSDGIGRVNLTVSGGKISGDPFVWVEEGRTAATITAGNSGTVTITATPEVGFSDSDGNAVSPSSRTVSVKIVAPTTTTPTAPITTPSTPSNPNSNSSKPSSTTKPTTQTPAQNNSNSSQSTNETTGVADTKPENGTEKEETEIIEETVAESPNEPGTQPNEDVCTESKHSLTLAWTIAIIFALLFFITLAILIYFILKNRKTPEAKSNPADKSSETKSQQPKAPNKAKAKTSTPKKSKTKKVEVS